MAANVVILTLCVTLYLLLKSSRLFHTVAYSASLGSVTNSDVTFAADPVLGSRNNHLLISEPWNVIAMFANGSLLSRLRFNNAQLIRYAIPHIWPLSVSATIVNLPPAIDDRDSPFALPMNEEIVVEATTTAAGPSRVNLIMHIAGPGWNRQRPSYPWTGLIRGTFVGPAGAAGAWSATAPITWERDPIGGSYDVLACEVVAANAIAFQLRFPNMPTSRNKQYRPGGLVQDTAALNPWPIQRGELGGMGVWGRFDTFTGLQAACFSDAAGGTYEVRALIGYVGDSLDASRQVPVNG